MDTVHVTRITSHGEVYGHWGSGCDPSGCAGDALYFHTVNADEVEVGSLYELDADLRVIAAIDPEAGDDE